MGLKKKGNSPNFAQVFEKAIEQRLEAIIQTYSFIGERFVTNVRSKIVANEGYRELMRAIPKVNGTMKVAITEGTPRYEDDTANLTSSVGYYIIKNGEIVKSNFTGKEKGVSAGKEAASTLAANYPKHIGLIVVAGMHYAAAVESLGYDVLTGSSFIAERELKEAFANLN